jgi:NAD(P)-dependent dehydrogenase (short-subunit alcohol dehydrogenase family)
MAAASTSSNSTWHRWQAFALARMRCSWMVARGVRATAVHPGGIRTELTRHLDDGTLEAMVGKINEELAAEGKPPMS